MKRRNFLKTTGYAGVAMGLVSVNGETSEQTSTSITGCGICVERIEYNHVGIPGNLNPTWEPLALPGASNEALIYPPDTVNGVVNQFQRLFDVTSGLCKIYADVLFLQDSDGGAPTADNQTGDCEEKITFQIRFSINCPVPGTNLSDQRFSGLTYEVACHNGLLKILCRDRWNPETADQPQNPNGDATLTFCGITITPEQEGGGFTVTKANGSFTHGIRPVFQCCPDSP